MKNLTWNADYQQRRRNEAIIKGKINCERYAINNSLYDKGKTPFLKKTIKILKSLPWW